MTQKELVLQYVKDFGSITPMEAFSELGITKLATVVSNLRLKDGMQFKIETIKSKNRYGKTTHYARYSFPEESEVG